MTGRQARIASSALLLAAALAASGCGEDPIEVANKQIVKRLDLKKSENGYTIGGDPFCEVERQLLNDADEVEGAAGDDELNLVVSSREGNVGVEGIPPFAPDCAEQARKQLNKLDPSEEG